MGPTACSDGRIREKLSTLVPVRVLWEGACWLSNNLNYWVMELTTPKSMRDELPQELRPDLGRFLKTAK